MKNNIEIRSANINDCKLVLKFIKELAEYEKILDQVSATEKDLKQKLFCDNPCAEVLLVFVDDNPAGIAIFYQNFSTFLCKPGLYIDDLFIKPEFRGQRLGTKLFDYMCGIAKSRDYGRVEWAVLDWNNKAKKFYESKGAKYIFDWEIYRLEEDVINSYAVAS